MLLPDLGLPFGVRGGKREGHDNLHSGPTSGDELGRCSVDMRT